MSALLLTAGVILAVMALVLSLLPPRQWWRIGTSVALAVMCITLAVS